MDHLKRPSNRGRATMTAAARLQQRCLHVAGDAVGVVAQIGAASPRSAALRVDAVVARRDLAAVCRFISRALERRAP